MARPTAALLILHVSDTSLWGDSAYSPEKPVMVVRLPFGWRDTARFGGESANQLYRGQSYDYGVHPPR